MKEIKNQYGRAALAAVKLCKDKKFSPSAAWKEAISSKTTSGSSRDKSCPRSAFLGLCEDGLVEGVAPGSYIGKDKDKLNKEYAIKAVSLLIEDPSQSSNLTALWRKVVQNKDQNNQMAFVVALWSRGEIRKSSGA